MNSLTETKRPEPIEEGSTAVKLRRSPLTDPRALAISLVIHVVVVVVASFVAFRVAGPILEPTAGRVMQGELDAVDNRATGEPGGTSGDPEGRSADLSAERGIPAPTTKNAAADALLSEILPTRDPVEVPSQTLPGPSTNGLGMLNASGSGEGGASSGSTVGGGGKGGTGPGTEFFGLRDQGRSFAYVIDCSASMTAWGSLDAAKTELLRSLDQFGPDTRFAVVFYNHEAKVFTDPSGDPALMAATPANKARVRTLLATIEPDGGTDHLLALKAAFDLHPEVIFFLTDADRMSRQEASDLIRQAGKIRIQAIEFGQVTGLGGSAPLKQLAKATGGIYRYIDVSRFAK